LKLVLLPGMDGTGILFKELLANIQGVDVLVLSLPMEGSQDYQSLAGNILQRLPDKDFILVAESFSGGIAAILSQIKIPHLKGLILVASFLSGPRKTVAYLASFLPLRLLAHLPFSNVVYRSFFLGKNAGFKEIELFKKAIDEVPTCTLKLRLKVIAQATYDGFTSNLPVVYIGATQDMLVPSGKRFEFVKAYKDITFSELDGPHFILQANPKESAAALISAINLLSNKGRGTVNAPQL
jgi:pimeloyl-[acyl-carrier protein] methyl ester esterase